MSPRRDGRRSIGSRERLHRVVAEVAGPAGAGKTTLIRTLAGRCGDLQVGIPLSRANLLRGYASATAPLLPTYLRRHRGTRWFTTDESRSMAYLGAWQHRLAHDGGCAAGVRVLDHGPIYRLVRLAEFGPPVTTSAAFQRWWEIVLAQWASTLDVVVWLDASDDVLLQRIRSRERAHVVRDASAADAIRFLARYRTGYGAVMARLAPVARLRVLQFDTARTTPSEVADDVVDAVCGTGRNG